MTIPESIFYCMSHGLRLTAINTPLTLTLKDLHEKQVRPYRIFFNCSFSLLLLLFPSFVLFLLLCILYNLLQFPLIYSTCLLLFLSPALPSSYLTLFSLLFQSGGAPFTCGRRKKKSLRLVRNLNNCAAQFHSWWTLKEEWVRDDFGARQGDLDGLVYGLCQYVFHRVKINVNFICSLCQSGPDGNPDASTWKETAKGKKGE